MALRRKNIPKACPFALICLYLQGKFVENQTFAVQDCESSIGNDRNDENDKLNLWQVLLPLLPLLMLLASCRKSAEETADNLRIENCISSMNSSMRSRRRLRRK